MAAAMKSELDDEEYDAVSDYVMSDPESDFEEGDKCNTPLTTPSTPRNPRPSDRKTLSCPYNNCSKTFNRRARLNEHLRSHTNTRLFKCPHCPKDFLRDSHMKHHVKSAHSNIRDYTCNYPGCGKNFATGTRLRRHEATHSGHDKYRCTGYESCNQTFRKRETLNRHILQAHQQIDPFPCTDVDSVTGQSCKKTFDTASKLKSHQRSMHDPTKFSCAICVQTQAMVYRDASNDGALNSAYFATYAALKRHVDAEHPPTCSHCSLKFKTRKELSRHIELVHDIVYAEHIPQAGPHECPYSDCDRTFSKKGNLNVHIRTVHEKRRDFVCGQTEVSIPEITSDAELVGCGRDFTSKSTLEEHIRTAHLGMQARRVKQNKKRKAEKQEAEDEDGIAAKKRRARKDKGVKKTSAIDSLVGFPMYRRGSIVEADEYDSEEDAESDAYSVYDDDEEAGLTGSMVMHGSQIFHGNNIYHIESAGSSLSTQQPAPPVHHQTEEAPLTGDQLPDFDFNNLTFHGDFDFSGTPSHGLTSTMSPPDLEGQSSLQGYYDQHQLPVDLPEGDWYYHFPQHRNTNQQPSPGNVVVDPLLLF